MKWKTSRLLSTWLGNWLENVWISSGYYGWIGENKGVFFFGGGEKYKIDERNLTLDLMSNVFILFTLSDW